MFEINAGDLPFVKTRQALLVLDLQNDFVSTGCILHVDKPPGFVEKIINLAQIFRKTGNVFWTRTQFEASRSINNSSPDAERVITDHELPHGNVDRGASPSRRMMKMPAKMKDLYGKLLAESAQQDAEEGLDDLDDDIDDAPYDNETFLTLEPGQRPRCCIPMSSGSNPTQAVVNVLDMSKDIAFTKTHYSAFKSGVLLQTLRGQFVTELFICGALTNMSIFATVMDAARYGFQITLVDDCLGYRSKARHDEARKQMIDTAGCEVMQSSEVISMINAKIAAPQSRPTDVRNRKRGGDARDLHHMMADMKLKHEVNTNQPNGRPLSSQSTKSDVSTMNVKPNLGNESSESILSTSDDSIEPPLQLPKRPGVGERKLVPNKIKTRRRKSDSVAGDSEKLGRNLKSGEKKLSMSPTHVILSGAAEALKGVVPNYFSLDSEDVTTAPISKQPDLDVLHEVESLSNMNNVSDLPPPKENGNGSMSQEVVSFPIPATKQPKSETLQPNGTALETEKIQDENAPVSTNGMSEKHISNLPSDSTYPICGGDSTIIHNLLTASEAYNIFTRVRAEVRWQQMSHQGGEVPRLVAVQGSIGVDGSIPIYRHPSDESPPLLAFSPTVSLIKTEVEKKLGHSVNHCLIQLYRSGTDYISEHSDKTLDIVPKTYIANVSLGAMRAMTFRTKRPDQFENKTEVDDGPGSGANHKDEIAPRMSCKAPLPHNSMCKMSLRTNEKWLHSIRQDKRPLSEKSEAELAFGGCRISLTFRSIGTFLDRDQIKIWGQGATSKIKDSAKGVVNGETAEAESMIRTFGRENRSSDFNWEETYGAGFDVLHISNTRRLYLSGDPIIDCRIKFALASKSIQYSEAKLSPLFNFEDGTETPDTFPVRFIDNDIAKSQVEGDLALLLYLDSTPASMSTSAIGKTAPTTVTPTHLQLSRKFMRLQQADMLLQAWRKAPFDKKAFNLQLAIWETYAREDQYIAGNDMGLVDWAFWPILHSVVGGLGELENLDLRAYYERIKGAEILREVLATKGSEEQGY